MTLTSTLMDYLGKETGKLDHELEEAHGEFDKTKASLEKTIAFYKRYENSDGLTIMDRLEVQNKKIWYMAHLLGLIEHEDMINKSSALTARIHELEGQVQPVIVRPEES
jgi:hypothetical protein